MRLPTHKYLSLDVIIISLAEDFRKCQFVRIHTIMHNDPKVAMKLRMYMLKGYLLVGNHLIGPVRKDGKRYIILMALRNLT